MTGGEEVFLFAEERGVFDLHVLFLLFFAFMFILLHECIDGFFTNLFSFFFFFIKIVWGR